MDNSLILLVDYCNLLDQLKPSLVTSSVLHETCSHKMRDKSQNFIQIHVVQSLSFKMIYLQCQGVYVGPNAQYISLAMHRGISPALPTCKSTVAWLVHSYILKIWLMSYNDVNIILEMSLDVPIKIVYRSTELTFR